MYKVVEKKRANKVIPHYLVTLSYMVGDGDEFVDKESTFYEDEFEEVIQKAIRVLEEFLNTDLRKHSRYYSHRLCLDYLEVILKNDLMSEEDRDILSMIILSRGDDYDDLDAFWGDDIPSTLTREVFEKYKKYAHIWDDLNLLEESDLGYYFLQGVNVEYVDENGVKHEVSWED